MSNQQKKKDRINYTLEALDTTLRECYQNKSLPGNSLLHCLQRNFMNAFIMFISMWYTRIFEHMKLNCATCDQI